MCEYRRLFVPTDRPSPSQLLAFCERVSMLRSWHKHLPLTHPGAWFIVYLNPAAGMRRRLRDDGSVAREPVTPETIGPHYSSMSTAEYRERYGLLALHVEPPPRIEPPPDGTSYGSMPSIRIDTPGGAALLPALTELGEFSPWDTTGVIHPRSGKPWVWKRYLDPAKSRFLDHLAILDWPDASGGPVVIEDIRQRVSRSAPAPLAVEAEVERLVRPERLRQRVLIRRQAESLLDAVFASAGC